MPRAAVCLLPLVFLLAAACGCSRDRRGVPLSGYGGSAYSPYVSGDITPEEVAAIEEMTERRRRNLRESFTEEERAYIDSLAKSGGAVKVGIVSDAYPGGFYNRVEKKYQGIAPEILAEVSRLTGVRFDESTVSPHSTIAELLTKLRDGELSMVTQVLYSESRKDDYIWSDIAYQSSKYALLSKVDFPKIDRYRVRYYRVGLIERSIHAEKFDQWFPGHRHRVPYPTGDAALNALERGEVHMVMVSESMLLALTNYREKTGYKINVSFDESQESRFGYHKGEERLRSIVDKAMEHIDVAGISDNWMTRTFDYSRKMALERLRYAIAIAVIAVAAALVLVLLLVKNRRLSRNLMAETEKHKAAEARAVEASGVKSRFLANMSHEIRTPLNVIIGMAELLSLEKLSKRQRDYVRDMGRASHSLLSVISDILDFSKIEAGKSELHPVDYDFHELMANIASMFRFMARKKGIDFIYEQEGGALPRYLYGDDARLRQVLINLCANAVNFTSRGFVRLKACCRDGKLAFEVKDTGPGIKPDDLEKLFWPFARAEEDRRRDVAGTGLGLPISKTYVEMMGGTIEVSSVYGQGSVFTVVVPMAAGDESRVRRGAGGGRGAAAAFRAPEALVLVVDDNALNLKVACRLLGLYGIAAKTAKSGAEAIEAVQKTEYDLVFMDHMMPGMDGVEATKRIRGLGGRHEKTPIVALTANATQGAREALAECGMDDYVTKPIELERLSEALEKWLPKGKVEFVSAEAASRVAIEESDDGGGDDSVWEKVGRIDGINAEIGRSRAAGSEEVYSEMLETFCGSLAAECRKLENFLNYGDMENFRISIHGMKSSLATIGAMALSGAALELETLSKGGNRQQCRQKLPDLLTSLHDLGEELAPICSAGAAAREERPKGEAVILEKGVKAALNAAEVYDGDKCADVLEKLLSYDFGAATDEALKGARHAVKNFDFEKTVSLLKRF